MLSLNGISKSFKGKLVVDNVNLHINKNQIYGLVGSNGAGKTTIMKMISGLLKESSGEITLFGQTGKSLVLARKSLGVLIENPALDLDVTAFDNLEYYFYAFGKNPSKNDIGNLLELVNLHNIEDKKVGEFSLGMKQRLGIAIALINDAKLLLLDEPTNGLDPIGIIEIRKLILNIVKEKGMSVLISSHILSELEQLADRFAFLHKGKIMSEISAEEMYSNLNPSLNIKIRNKPAFENILHEMGILDRSNYDIQNQLFSIPIGSVDINEFFRKIVYNKIDIIDIDIKKTNLENYYINVIEGK